MGYKTALVCPLLCWATLAKACHAESGLDPQKAITQFHQDIWTTDEGLPQNTVTAVLQTRDGYIWLGTELGLVRFDGIQFTVFDKGNTPELKSNLVSALVEDHLGNLWIGTIGGGLTRLGNKKFSTFTTKDGLSKSAILSLFEDRTGNLWIGTDGGGVNYLRNGRISSYTAQDGLPDNEVFAITEDPDGSLWFGTHDGLCHFSNGLFRTYGIRDGLPSAYVRSLHMTPAGTLWIGTYGGGVARYREGKFRSFTTSSGLSSNSVTCVREDNRGSLWIGTYGGGVNRLAGSTFTAYTAKDGLSSNDVWAIFQDREGNLWIGTGGGGLGRLFDGQLFTTYGSKEGLSNSVVLPIYEDHEGTIWIGTNGGGLNRFRDGKFTALTTKQGLADNLIFSISEDHEGALWVGTRKGLNRIKNGKIATYTRKNGLPSDAVLVIYVDGDDALWVGTRSGLARFQDGRFTIYRASDGLSSTVVRVIQEDHRHRLWIGTGGGGLNLLVDGRFAVFDSRRGLSNDVVSAIHEDADGVLWIGTNGGGLNRLKDGKFTTYTSKDGLLDDAISRILQDDSGNLWMSSNKGVFRASIRALNDFADGKISHIPTVTYGTVDGMRTRECNGGFQPAGWKAHDGRLWFPTMKGAVVVDPRSARSASAPPAVILEGAVIDRHTFDARSDIQAPPGRGEFEFHYTAPSFRSAQRIIFRYKLEGFDRDWVDAGSRRVAYYTNIPPGRYRFEVIASDDGELWSASKASLNLVLKSHFHQTIWFYTLCAFALIGLVSTGQARHVRTLRRREKMLSQHVNERTAELRREIAERQRAELELLKAKEAAEHASRVKSEFLANMSHEIRTPMNGILGMTDMAIEAASNPEQQTYLEIVKTSAESLLTIIDDILDFSKVEAGKLDLELIDFNLRDRVEETVRSVAFQAHQKGLEIVCDLDENVPGVVKGDPVRIRQIILNLLGNAIKFTERGEIVLHIQCEERDNSQASLHVVVRDTGIGIPRDKLGSIFEAFSQADSTTTRRFGGTGLGLAICSHLVALMGGKIWATSELGRGSEFHFAIKVGIANAPQLSGNAPGSREAKHVEATAVPSGLKVLLAEDNPANRMVARLTLERAGFQVYDVEDGRGALDAIRRAKFDVVLMDCRMPGVDGYAAAKQIRQLPDPSNRVPIIALTASAFEEDRERARQAGMNDFLSKPFRSRELVQKCIHWAVANGAISGRRPGAEESLKQEQEDATGDLSYPPEFVQTLLEIFLDTAPPVFCRFLGAIENANWLEAQRCAHWLRGGACRILNPALEQQLSNFENECVASLPSIAPEQLQVIKELFDSTCARANEIRAQRNSRTALA